MTPPREIAIERGEGKVVAERHRQHQPFRLAVLRDERHADRAATSPRCGLEGATGAPATRISPETPRNTPNSASSSSRWPCPSRPPSPTTSPAWAWNEMSRRRSAQLRPPDLDERRRGRLSRGGGFGGKTWLELPADHHLDDLVVGLRPREIGRDIGAVAKDGAVVGEFGDLMHPMRDVEEREPLVAQSLQDHEHLGDVRRGQRRRRLVENEDTRVARQRLGDLDHLPARQRQIPDERHRVDVRRAGALERLLGDAPLRAPVDQAEALRRIADGDVVGDREIGDERQLLEDADDAGAVGGGRRVRKRPRRPSSTMRPASGLTTPDRILISVDLPAPFSPRMAWMRPAEIARSASSSARTPP